MIRLFALLVAASLSVAHPGAQTSQPTAASREEVNPTAPVNLNTATSAALEKLPGIGPRVAARILEYRQKNGAFKKIEELMNVQGIGEKSFLRLRSQITVGSPADSAVRKQN